MKNTFFIIDNSLYMQNQDYIPKRIICVRDIINKMINNTFNARNDSKISIIPTSHEYLNNFVSPSSDRNTLINFLNRLELAENFDLNYSLRILDAFTKSMQEANIFIFLGTKPTDFNAEVLSNILKYFNVKIILFGEAIDFKIEGDVLRISSEKDFNQAVSNFCGKVGIEEEEDEVLKMVLEKSKTLY